MQHKRIVALVASAAALALPANALAGVTSGLTQLNTAQQGQTQGLQVNVSPNVALGSDDQQSQANQDQTQVSAQSNSAGSPGGQTGAPQGQVQPASAPVVNQLNAAGQSQTQGLQVNVSPNVALGSDDQQSQANQDQVSAQSNNTGSGQRHKRSGKNWTPGKGQKQGQPPSGSTPGQKGSGGPCGSHHRKHHRSVAKTQRRPHSVWTPVQGQGASDTTKQVNVASQKQVQGLQLNLSPNLAFGNGNQQSQTNQDQGQLNLQGNSDD